MLISINKIGRIQPKMVCNLFFRPYCSNVTTEITKNKRENVTLSFSEVPAAPTTCCMSGCPNCVWLDYADKLAEYFKDGGERAWKEINMHVSDPNVKAYLMHELRMRNKHK